MNHPVFLGKLFQISTTDQGLVSLSEKPERKKMPQYHGVYVVEPKTTYIAELGEREKSSTPQFESFEVDPLFARHGIVCSFFREDGKDMCLMTKTTEWPVEINVNARIGTLMIIS